MRHIIVAASMLMVALVVTFGAASVLQGAAVANVQSNVESYTVVEAPKSAPAKTAAAKERLTSQSRERSLPPMAQIGL